MQPGGHSKGVQLVVDDIQVAHKQLSDRGVDVSDVQDLPGAASSSSVSPTARRGPSSSDRRGRETTRSPR